MQGYVGLGCGVPVGLSAGGGLSVDFALFLAFPDESCCAGIACAWTG
jgi:hypothetical protein